MNRPTPKRLARSCVKTTQPTAATTSKTKRTMKKVPTGLTAIFGHRRTNGRAHARYSGGGDGGVVSFGVSFGGDLGHSH